MKQLASMLLFLFVPFAVAKTVSSVAVSPQGAVIRSGSTLQFHASCKYDDGSTDDCTAAGGVTWSTARPADVSVNSSGLVKWISTTFPGTGISGSNLYETSWVIASAGALNDRAGVYGQFPGDSWIQFMSPSPTEYYDSMGGFIPMKVAVGATVTIGSGFQLVHEGKTSGGYPLQQACNWSSSDLSRATVDTQGLVTTLAPGNITITCGRAGDALWGGSTQTKGWVSPGNTITFAIVPGGEGNQTWYVRPNGGTPYINSQVTPKGQCDGKHDADYPGSGTNRPCAVGNLSYLWQDLTTAYVAKWMIRGGDTVIVRQKPEGYQLSLTAPLPASGPWSPVNCQGNVVTCYMPSVPSGTSSRHTRILGENYASCHADAAMTKILGSYSAGTIVNVSQSQFVDVQCFQITDNSGCGAYAHACKPGEDTGVRAGVMQSALTSQVNLTDLFIHGTGTAIYGASGAGIVADHIHIRGVLGAGIDMDDTPWGGLSNFSVSGGYTLTNSVTEFVGCLEEYPVVHKYPFIECVDASTGGYGDGFATGSTVGDWKFDHDVWRANFQDGLDLLHSGMHSLSVTNSYSVGNEGQPFKIGSARNVVFQNNVAVGDCGRLSEPFGDEPASALAPGGEHGSKYALCRASGDGIVVKFDNQGIYRFQNNTFIGYGTPYDLACDDPWSHCQSAVTIYQNNVVFGVHVGHDGDGPALFYLGTTAASDADNKKSSLMPRYQGWSVRDHNLYYNLRPGYCPSPLRLGETCTVNPLFINQPSSSIAHGSLIDDFLPAPAANSPLNGAGTPVEGLTHDFNRMQRPTPPSIGAIESESGSKAAKPPNQESALGEWKLRVESWFQQIQRLCLVVEGRLIRPVLRSIRSRLAQLYHRLLG
jgi:Bacterial Ig-like domain (group 2)